LLGVAGPYIVLERISGIPLWETEGDEVAGTVGTTIRSMVDALAGHVEAPFVLRYDAAFYARWLRRACIVDTALDRLAGIYAAATERLLRERQTLIHGELYPSNVVVGERIWVVDWESAAVGPAVIDLAAAVSAWPEAFERGLLDAYGQVDRVALDCARLHLAVRWLGWSAGWTPPREHAKDWRIEAEQVAARLERTLR
jgi:aminoglycoside phosphotransferase (APT) family kinase protein